MRDATKEEQKAELDYIRSISHRILDVPIPNTPTNGDIIKAVFPNDFETIKEVCIPVNKCFGEPFTRVKIGESECTFELSWWNAPYKREHAAAPSNDSLTEPSAELTDPSREIEEDGFITLFFDR